MSTVLYTLAPTATRIRYREPYLSDALNKKYQSIVPFGVYEGLNPAPSALAQSLDLLPGSIGHAAVVESDLDNTVQVSVHLDGTLTLDLSAQAGQTVVVLLEATYAYPQETTAYIKMYLEGDPAIPASACTICKVDVPATAVVLTDADISLTGRTFPWDTRDRNAVPMLALAKNAGFEFVSESVPSIGVAPPYWNLTTAGVGQFQMSNSPGPSGTGGYVVGRAVAPIGSTHTNTFYQRYSVPVSSANNRIRFGVQFQPILQTTLSNPVLTVTLINPVTGATIQTLTIELDSSAPFVGSWTQYEETLEAYSVGADGACVAQLTLSFNSVQYGATGDAFYATDFVLEVEADSKAADVGGQLGGDTRFNTLTLTDANYATNKGVVLSHSASTDVMSLAAVPGVTGTPGLYVPGTLTIGGGVVFSGDLTVNGTFYANGGNIQRSTVGTLNVGTDATNVTTLTLGNAPAGGSVSAFLLGNNVYVGTAAASTVVYVGALIPPTTSRVIYIGVNNASTTVDVRGATISLGQFLTSTINIGTSTTSSAAITLGNAFPGGSIATSVAGNAISIGTSSDTNTITIGDGVSGTVRVAQYLDGNTGNLSLGTNSTYSTSVTIGNTGRALTVEGSTVGIGTTSPSGTVTLSRTGQTTAIAGNSTVAGTSTYTGVINANGGIDRSTSGALTIGSTSSVTGINIGTTTTTGGVTISRTGQNTVVQGNLGVGAAPSYLFETQGTNSPVLALTQTSATGVAQYPSIQNTAYSGIYTGHPTITMRNSRGSSASPTALAANDMLGTLIWYGNASTTPTWAEGARIEVTATAVPSTSTITTEMVFKTANAASSSSERMRISSTGNTTVTTGTQYAGINLSNGSNTVAQIYGSTAANDSGVLKLNNGGSTTVQLSAGNGIDSYFTGGKVGIGLDNPGVQLHSYAAAGTTVYTRTQSGTSNADVVAYSSPSLTAEFSSGTSDVILGTSAAGKAVALWTGGSSRLSVGSTGNVTINAPTSGTTLALSTVSGGQAIYAAGTGSNSFTLVSTANPSAAAYPQLAIQNYTNAGGYPVVELLHSRGTSTAQATVQTGDILGGYDTWGWGSVGGAGFKSATRINGVAEANFNTATTAGLRFITTNAGTQAIRMSISGPGNVTIDAPASGAGLSVTGGSSDGPGGSFTGGAANGHGISATGTGVGFGVVASGLSVGVYGNATSASGVVRGGYFTATASTGGIGAYGNGTAIGLSGLGVIGVQGQSSGGTAFNCGVKGLHDGAGIAVYGTVSSGTGTAVRGEALGSGYGGHFSSASGTALYVTGAATVTGTPTVGDYAVLAPSKTIYVYAYANEFQVSNGTGSYASYTATGNMQWQGNGSGAYKILARIKMPVNATVTDIQAAFYNGTGVVQAPSCAALKYTYAPSPTANYTAFAIANVSPSATISLPASMPTYSWFSLASVTNTQFVDGTIMLFEVTMPVNPSVRFEAVRVTCTQNTFGREV